MTIRNPADMIWQGKPITELDREELMLIIIDQQAIIDHQHETFAQSHRNFMALADINNKLYELTKR